MNFLVRDNKSTDGFSQVDQKRTVLDVITSDLRRIALVFGKVLSGSGSKNGKTNNSVTNHGGSVLYKHGVEDSHQEFLSEDHISVSVESVETCVNVGFLPLLAIVESDLFRMRKEFIV